MTQQESSLRYMVISELVTILYQMLMSGDLNLTHGISTKPIIAEFCDAYNGQTNQEDQNIQSGQEIINNNVVFVPAACFLALVTSGGNTTAGVRMFKMQNHLGVMALIQIQT